MKFKTFTFFVAPSLLMMLVFIAFPLVSVFVQSFFVTRPHFETVEVETCSPGFLKQTCVTEAKSRPVLDEDGKTVTTTQFVGLQSYARVLEPAEAFAAIAARSWRSLMAIDFWKALRFTLTFTLITLPFVVGLGLGVALLINYAAQSIKGPVIFISLLPYIITPVIGALSVNWLFRGDGVLTVALEWMLGHDIAMFAQGWTIELMMMLYRVWHIAPFAGIIFYAGLQSLNQDSIESAMIDGANRWQRLRYVVLPHLKPLVIFVTMIHLMDSYRVFEEVIGFSSQGHVISLQWLTYDLLTPDDAGNRAISRASASAMLTMVGIAILLVPLVRRSWREHKGAA